MAGQLATLLAAMGATSHWQLGEAAGPARDIIGGNDGIVTGVEQRTAIALNDQGDGSLAFSGINEDLVTVAAAANVDNIWATGGSFFGIIHPRGGGEADAGRIWFKVAGGYITMRNEAAGFVDMQFRRNYSITNGLWNTAVDIPIDTTSVIVWTHDASSTANTPTLHIHDGTTRTTRTVGSGLTETGTPDGVDSDDSGSELHFGQGDEVATNRTFDGFLDEFAAFKGIVLSQQQAYELIEMALSERAELPPWVGVPAATSVVSAGRVVAV